MAAPTETQVPRKTMGVAAFVVLGVLTALLAGGWGYVMWASKGQTEVIDQVVAFKVVDDDTISVTFDVVKPAESAAVCRLGAMDRRRSEVGSREVVVPAGEGSVRLTEALQTSAPATSGYVVYCHLK
ncbi:DUF4307 domain-containing protein [Rhizohabitans arisaemae]|uniref:DUF4307 domain-containing protein n=1 Tax=Rhizohabitans arisaemae TaxID=2720610 RepID=UPI0024B1B662|nr:DUF4307 domain-containing protein [Rhizohabitans arisaemae]